MLKQLLDHISRHNIGKTTDKILLAVSGGIDSMVMLDLFKQAFSSIGVVHCNFQLRGEDSEADEQFVISSCQHLRIPVFTKKFETKSYALSAGISVQMAARDLRYAYFRAVAAQHGYKYIATAHHHNDNIETVLLNLVRGTGLAGLTGIPVLTGDIIRPMLFATRKQIADYAMGNGVTWREDVSNENDDYQRNFLRHEVLPLLMKLNPGLENTFQRNIEKFQGAQGIVNEFLKDFQTSAITFSGETMKIQKDLLMPTQAGTHMLWEILKDKGFRFEQCQRAVETIQSGKKFFSRDHVLTVDRDYLIIESIARDEIPFVEIYEDDGKAVMGQLQLQINRVKGEAHTLVSDAFVAQLNYDEVKYPLIWRKWRPGDSFVPLGMIQHKKVSDFLIDEKVSVPDKARVTVLESAGRIMWIVGFRISNEFKLAPGTRNVMLLRLLENKL